jgi:hypothetical protein
MLAKFWRLHVYNDTDQILTYADGARVGVRMMPWKLVSGALSYGTAITDDTAFLNTGETIAIDGSKEGTVQDNSSNLYYGIRGYLEATADLTSTDGTIYLYLEESDANGSDWPSDQADFNVQEDCRLVAALTMSTDAADESRGTNFEF